MRLVDRQAKVARPAPTEEAFRETLASLFQLEREAERLEALHPETTLPPSRGPGRRAPAAFAGSPLGRVDVPFTIGRRR